MHAGFRRLHRIVLVVNGGCRTGQIVDLIDFEIDGKRHIMANELESLVVEQVLDVAPRPGKEIIEADDFGALRQQPFAKM